MKILEIKTIDKTYYVTCNKVLLNRTLAYLNSFITSHCGTPPEIVEIINNHLKLKPLEKKQIIDIHLQYMDEFSGIDKNKIIEMFNNLIHQGYCIENN
jgi:hypothetical protein